ncbi:hypothetical protein Nmel_016017 [Mimus melanotis]
MGEAGALRRPPGLRPMAEQVQALEPGWLLSPAGRPYLDSILHKNQRRVFGGCPPCAPQAGVSAPQNHPEPPPQVCWSARRCRLPWLSPLSPTNSSWRGEAASGRQRWWPGWGGPPRPPPTTRPWGSRPPRCSGRPSPAPAAAPSCSSCTSGTAGTERSGSSSTCCP